MEKKDLTERRKTTAEYKHNSDIQQSIRLKSVLSYTQKNIADTVDTTIYDALTSRLGGPIKATSFRYHKENTCVGKQKIMQKFLDDSWEDHKKKFAQHIYDNFGLSKGPYEIRRLFAWGISDNNPLLVGKGKKKLGEKAVYELYRSLVLAKFNEPQDDEESSEDIQVPYEVGDTSSRTISGVPVVSQGVVGSATVRIVQPKDGASANILTTAQIEVDGKRHGVDISAIYKESYDPVECVFGILDPMQVRISGYDLNDEYKAIHGNIVSQVGEYNEICAIPVRTTRTRFGMLQHKKKYGELSRSEQSELESIIKDRASIKHIQDTKTSVVSQGAIAGLSSGRLGVLKTWLQDKLSKSYNTTQFHDPVIAIQQDIAELKGSDRCESFMEIFVVAQQDDGSYALQVINKDNINCNHNRPGQPHEQYGFSVDKIYSVATETGGTSFYNGKMVEPYIHNGINTYDDAGVNNDTGVEDFTLLLVGDGSTIKAKKRGRVTLSTKEKLLNLLF